MLCSNLVEVIHTVRAGHQAEVEYSGFRKEGNKSRCKRHQCRIADGVEVGAVWEETRVGGDKCGRGCPLSREDGVWEGNFEIFFLKMVHFYTLHKSNEARRFTVTLLVKLCNIYSTVIMGRLPASLGTASAAAKSPSTPEWQLGNSAPTPNPHAQVSP